MKEHTPALKRRGHKWLRIILFCIIALALIWTLYVQWTIHQVEDTKIVGKRDVGIVLGAALWNDVPSPALKERLDHALALYERDFFDTIIVSGGYDHEQSRLTEAQGMKNYLIGHGVAEEDVLLENMATSTLENLMYSQIIMFEQGYETAVIITHEYHGARALDIAQFLDFVDPSVSTVQSKVMNMPYNKARETLAFAKWKLDQLRLNLGIY